MRIDGMQERASRQAIRAIAAGRAVIRYRAGVATDGVLRLVAEGWIVDPKLGYVEDIEGFGAELEFRSLGDGKMLE